MNVTQTHFFPMLQSLSPGAVKTEFAIAAGYQNFDPEIFNQVPFLESKDIVDAVLYILGTPPHVQV
jgi:NADP-dependent 3-hydroxy acid dehydrogenase YdfG